MLVVDSNNTSALRDHLRSLDEEGSSDADLRANISDFRAVLDPDITPILNQGENIYNEASILVPYPQKSSSGNNALYIRAMIM
jgi:hypothetical protein